MTYVSDNSTMHTTHYEALILLITKYFFDVMRGRASVMACVKLTVAVEDNNHCYYLTEVLLEDI